MRVSEAMHKSVAWVSPQTKVPEIAKIMKEHDTEKNDVISFNEFNAIFLDLVD